MRREEQLRKQNQKEISSKNSKTKSTISKDIKKNKVNPEDTDPKEKKSRCTIL